MVALLLSHDMYKVLARYAILGHDCIRVCVVIVCMARMATQVLYVSSLYIYFVSACCTLSSLKHQTSTRIAGRRHQTCDLSSDSTLCAYEMRKSVRADYVESRDVEVEAEAESGRGGSGTFSVEAEAKR